MEKFFLDKSILQISKHLILNDNIYSVCLYVQKMLYAKKTV